MLKRVIVALGTIALPSLAVAQEPADRFVPSITVEGVASVAVVPDIARLSIGVDVERPTASSATSDAAKAAQAVVDQLKTEGLADKDVATGVVALSPLYPEDRQGAAAQPRSPRAYRAAIDLEVTIKPAERAGLIAAHVVDKGANTIEGIAFASSEGAKRIDDLRADAMRDARRKAQIYVDALNLKLGRVLEITPQGESGGAPKFVSRAAPMAMSAPTARVPVEPGELELRASVAVRWEIVP